MITQPTVLVLGAGASMPFGFPSGPKLKSLITGGLVKRDPMHSLILQAGFDITHIEDFRTALLKSGKRSVDAFLEHRPEYLDVGKAATACALLPLELEDPLFAAQESWYDYFFNKLNAQFEEFVRNSVSVVTFNYDRSLEHYLLTALHNSYGKPLEECRIVLRYVPIIHLYGQLGQLRSLSGEGIRYGSGLNLESLRTAANGIKIIHEAVPREGPFKQAHDLLRNASRVCFLGFGFDETNTARLLGYGANGGPLVYASAVGFSPREAALIQNRLRGLGFNNIRSVDDLVSDSLQFLHQHCPFD